MAESASFAPSSFSKLLSTGSIYQTYRVTNQSQVLGPELWYFGDQQLSSKQQQYPLNSMLTTAD